jgi:molecular chaperone GrpE (heat shock protein)
MRKAITPKLPKWPFFAGDALLLALAAFICFQGALPLGRWELFTCAIDVLLGAGLAVLPFLLEHRAAVRLAEAEGLATAVSQIKNLEQLAVQIGYATSQWQIVRESADKTANSAKEIAHGMASEIKAFNAFIQRASDDEKATLRLEVEKLRRAEVEWLQALVRMLDHVYALHQAALRSRQAGVAEQLSKFQMACYDTARRVGLAPFVAATAETFNAERHQLIDNETKAPDGAVVEETLASGYTFQGRLIRPAVVKLQNSTNSAARNDSVDAGERPAAQPDQNQLPLEVTQQGSN